MRGCKVVVFELVATSEKLLVAFQDIYINTMKWAGKLYIYICIYVYICIYGFPAPFIVLYKSALFTVISKKQISLSSEVDSRKS